MYRIVFLIVVSAGFARCKSKPQTLALPFYNTADFTPQFLNKPAAEKTVTHTIAPFSFTNQHGQTVTDKDISGKIHIANFFFTRCGSICPQMTANLVTAEKKLQGYKDVVLLSFSVTPWQDSVPRLQEYAGLYQISSPNWHLLTGSKAAIYDLARKSYFAEESLGLTRDSSEFLHTEHILLVDRQKRIRGIYNGTLPLETEQLVKDAEQLLKE